MAGNGIRALVAANSGNGEQPAPLQLRTGMVTAIDNSATPWTVSVQVSELVIPGINILGWYEPRVGDVVQLLQQGESLFVLGTVGPGKIYAPSTPPPAPPPPPPPPPPPLVTKAYPISPVGSGTWPSQQPIGSWSNLSLWQGGSIAQRAYWFYGNKIADAKGSGTILSGTVFVKRRSSGGVYGNANVRLGSHNLATQPASAGALSNVSVVGGLQRDQGKTFTIPASIIAGMNAGTIKGLGLEPGALGYVTPDYLIAYPYGAGTEWSGAITLNIRK